MRERGPSTRPSVRECEARKPQSGITLWVAKRSTKGLFPAWCWRTHAEGAHKNPHISDFVSRLRIKIASRRPV
jgi:hypothetical protein